MWIDIDVEIEHNEALTSQAQHIIKCKIEELVVKKGEALTKKTASSRIIAETAVSSTSSNEDVQQNNSEPLPFKLPRLLEKYSRIRSGKNLQETTKKQFLWYIELTHSKRLVHTNEPLMFWHKMSHTFPTLS